MTPPLYPHPSNHALLHQRVPVFAGPRVLELADPARVRQLMRGSNVEVVRKKKTRQIVQINLLEAGNDECQKPLQANPRRYSHDHEVDQPGAWGNPRGVWMLRKLGRGTCDACGARLEPQWLRCPATVERGRHWEPCGRVTIAGVFRLAVTDCLTAAAA